MRIFKQFVYGLFYIAVFGGLVFGFYSLYIKPAPSCFNEIKDASEEGIDCGGVCSKICLSANFRPIETGGVVQIFHPTESGISAIIQIQNPNSDLAARSFPYDFVFYDAQGGVIKKASGNSFIYASEIKYITELNIQFTDSAKITSVQFVPGQPNWVSKSLFNRPQLSPQNSVTSVYGNGIQVNGNFVNNDTVPINQVTVLAVFYNQLGQQAGISKSETGSVAPGQQQAFSIFHPLLKNINLSATKIYLYGY